jgi:RimJ/RimL family protein N-acetyltransferase
MEELIGTEVDNFGNEIKVYFCSHETMPAKLTAFFAKQWAELLEAGLATSNFIPNINACRVIYLTVNDEIIGLRLWVWEQNNTRIILTSIDKNYRRRGLLKLIVKYYDNRIAVNCNRSITFIHVDNVAMIEAARQSGYEVEFLKMIKRYNI